MFCSKCGARNDDHARFCVGCGSPLQTAGANKKKSGKTIWIIAGAIVIVLAIAAALILGLRGKKAKEYEGYLESAARYVEELNYEQAKEYYLKAIAVAPKELEPYVRLAEIYVSEGDLLAAERILEKARENEADGNEITRIELKAVAEEIQVLKTLEQSGESIENNQQSQANENVDNTQSQPAVEEKKQEKPKQEEPVYSNEWKKELEQTEKKARELEAELQNAMSQYDINYYSGQLYKLWDDQINVLWQHLKKKLPKAEMDALTAEQKEWIKEKEAAIEEAGKEWEGGSGQPMAEYTAGWTMTEERVYELAEYMK